MDTKTNIKYGLLKYESRHGRFNVGDYIQSIAAQKFLPQTHKLISRERLMQYNGEPVFIILNGWFLQEPNNWPPSEKINPLIVSFHINKSVKNQLTSKESILFYKKNEPIGCRDYYTRDLLLKNGVDAYFSGCITLTLNKEDFFTPEYEDRIYICDAFNDLDFYITGNTFIKLLKLPVLIYKKIKKRIYLHSLIPRIILSNSTFLKNYRPDSNYSVAEKFVIAEEQLKHFSSAKLVITSRIHVALPCLAFGTPVLFIDRKVDSSRMKGLIELFNVVSEKKIFGLRKEKKKINWNGLGNSDNYKIYRKKLINLIQEKLIKL